MEGNMGPSRGSGIERGLTFEPESADNGRMGSSWAPRHAHASAERSRERGQALVEFALIVPLFLLLVVGVVQFGVGLNYWLDLNRLANQGARWAVVNCQPASAGVCRTKNTPQTDHIELAIAEQRTSGGNLPTVKVCYETTRNVGQPLTAYLQSEFGFKQILNLPSITLNARATMRIEQPLTSPALAPGKVDRCDQP
jgi:TadE-like protein